MCLARIWGLQNREAPIRLIEDDASEAVSNVELKCLDSTMNPYIALTAITQAGMLGMQSSARLPPKCQSDPASEVHPCVLSSLGTRHIRERVDDQKLGGLQALLASDTAAFVVLLSCHIAYDCRS